MVCFAPCKINLGLNITLRRSDGYHEIESVMLPVSGLCDIVEVLPTASGVVFEASGIAVDCKSEDNLCVKAYNEFSKHYNVGGVYIHLYKNVPFGAGLGGGSSDATAVLKAVNEIYGCRASVSLLESMAANLGSDTVFFVESKPKLCTGRGEILSPVSISLKGTHITIVKPDIYISSKVAYSGVVPKKNDIKIEEILSLPIEKWKECLKNDFEDHLFDSFGELAIIKQMLYEAGAEYVSLSGSGSAIYALSETKLNLMTKKQFERIFVFQDIL